MSLTDEHIIKIFQGYVERRLAYEFNSPDVGKIAVTIINMLLNSKTPLSDDRIAASLNISVTDDRKILQVLYRLGIVSLSRETHDQYRYEYRWQLTKEHVKKYVQNLISMVIDKLVRVVKCLSSTVLYYCPTCFSRYTIDEVYDFNFECPLDNTPLIQIDIDKELTFLNNVIKDLSKLIQGGKGGQG